MELTIEETPTPNPRLGDTVIFRAPIKYTINGGHFERGERWYVLVSFNLKTKKFTAEEIEPPEYKPYIPKTNWFRLKLRGWLEGFLERI